jgi:FkbM family methyltransferase
MVQGDWEPWISQAMLPYLQGASFYDVGANIGWYSLLAEKAGAKQVAAFEPNPVLWKLIWRTMSVNGFDWDLRGCALGDEERDDLELVVPWDLAGGASVKESGKTRYLDEERFKISVRLFDDEVREKHKGSSAVMKFDVEGFEPKALLGAKNFIKHNSPTIFFEYHPDPHNQMRLHDALEFLQGERYQVAHVGIDAKLHPIDYSGITSVPSTDMLAFRKLAR